MQIEHKKFKEAISKLPSEPIGTVLHGAVKKWLIEIGTPQLLIDFLSNHCFLSFVSFKHVRFNEPNSIILENEEEQNQGIYERGLLIIGAGLNGDPIVVNAHNGKVGFVNHDELWEGDIREIELSEIYRELDESVGSFFLKAMTVEEFPVDYYSALDYEQDGA